MSSLEATDSNIFDVQGNVLHWRMNRALGAVVGACIGDAVGAPLEKIGRQPTSAEVTRSMQLPGTPSLAAGQVTDDGEMTVSLANALSRCCKERNGEFDLELVAQCYADWVRSSPVDCGITIGSSIGVARSQQKSFRQQIEKAGYALMMQSGAKFEAKHAPASQSNGQLMRCSPLALYGYRFSPSELHEICKADASLSHIAEQCADSSTAYIIALVELLKHEECTGKAAVRAAISWARTNACKDVREWLLSLESIIEDSEACHGVENSQADGNEEHQQSVAQETAVHQNQPQGVVEEEERKLPAVYPMAGYVKIALLWSLYFLYKETPFAEAMYRLNCKGGDTDTNSCITGALLGALYGFNALPHDMKAKVLAVNPKNTRPFFLQPNILLHLVPFIIEHAPPSLAMAEQASTVPA